MMSSKDFLLAQAKFSFVKRKSVLMCAGCLMKEQEREFIIRGYNVYGNYLGGTIKWRRYPWILREK